MSSAFYSYRILIKFIFSIHILEKILNIKFQENPFHIDGLLAILRQRMMKMRVQIIYMQSGKPIPYSRSYYSDSCKSKMS